MTFLTMLAETGTVGAVGAQQLFSTSDSRRNFQFNPKQAAGFSGTVVLEGSSAASPGSSDWVQLVEVICSAHTQNFSVDVFSDMPWMRARMTASSTGAMSVYASE